MFPTGVGTIYNMPMTAAKIQKNNNKSRTIKIIFISLPHDLKLYQSFNQIKHDDYETEEN
jgi:hypothetical protein